MSSHQKQLAHALSQEVHQTLDLAYPAPHHYGVDQFWPKVEEGRYSTVAAKASQGQHFENTFMVFLSDMDEKHSFSPNHIQTRYNEMVVDLKLHLLVELSDLDYFFLEACKERKTTPWMFDARYRYVKYWHETNDDFHYLSEKEIMVFARKLAETWRDLKALQEHISNTMDTGVANPADYQTNLTKVAVHSLETLLGAYTTLCGMHEKSGFEMVEMAVALVPDPLTAYLDAASGGIDAIEADATDDIDENSDNDSDAEMEGIVSESNKEQHEPQIEEVDDAEFTRLLQEGLEEMQWKDSLEAKFRLDVKPGHRERPVHKPIVQTHPALEDPAQAAVADMAQIKGILDDIEILTDNMVSMGGVSVSDDFKQAMKALDSLSVTDKVEVLKKNADAVAEAVAAR